MTTVTRGCGTRKEGGLYICIKIGATGRPIDDFLIDPIIPWTGPKNLRSPMLIQGTTDKTINHLVMGVGKQYYPTIPDYIEEARLHGISKRIPLNFPFDKLTPGKSQLILAHSRAIPQFEYQIEHLYCPQSKTEKHECIGALWSLSTLHDNEKHRLEETDNNQVIIHTPSTHYITEYPQKPPHPTKTTPYNMGLFIHFPTFHLEYINKENKVPTQIKKITEAAGIDLHVVEK